MYSQGNLQKLFAYFFHALSKSASSLVSITNETNLFSKDLIFDYLKSTHGFFESLLIKKCWKLFTKTRLYLWPGARESLFWKPIFCPFALLVSQKCFQFSFCNVFLQGVQKETSGMKYVERFQQKFGNKHLPFNFVQ